MISAIVRLISLFFALRQYSFTPHPIKECPVEEIVAKALKSGKTCVFVDTKRSFDLKQAAMSGVRPDDLIVTQPSSREEAIGICERLVESGSVDLMIVDSLSALTLTSELEGLSEKELRREESSYRKQLDRLGSCIAQTRTQCIFLD